MSRLKTLVAVLVVAAIVGIVPQANATVTVEVTAAGSSAQWQSMAIAAYDALTTATKGHWTSASNVISLVDSRTSPQNIDLGTLWVVWSCTTTACTSADVWMFNKVDSVVGDRCFFAVPVCTLTSSSANLSGNSNNKIAAYLFKDGSSDSVLPSAISTLVEDGTPIGVAATDIRPEDAMFAMCRANSALGAGTGPATTDNLDGLGYNSHNASGVCPAGPLGATSNQAVGTPITSGLPGAPAGDQANVVAFNVVAGGNDPITGSAVPAWTVVNVGAAPVVIVKGSKNSLASLQNASPRQLQLVFSGHICDADVFDGPDGSPLASGGLNIFLREPSSGTMNTTEATLFRGPTVSPNNGTATAPLGYSQEWYVGSNDPLAGQSGTCNSGNANSARYRGIGTSEVVDGVINSNLTSGLSGGFTPFPTQQDGIAYTFFSFGNVKGLNDSANYGYITINDVDPIFATYNPSTTAASFDPAQPKGGELPGQADLIAIGNCTGTTNGYPCAENQIWTGGLSFPNVRTGAYPAWSLLRAIAKTTGGQLTALKTLVANSNKNVVSAVPDYIPYALETCTPSTTPIGCPTEVKDPGLLVLRAHYLQTDGGGNAINTGTIENFTKGTTFTEAGGDMGGEVFVCPTAQTDCPNQAAITHSSAGIYLPQSQQVVWGLGVVTSSTVGGYSGGFTVRP